jgi:tetratricopeptide (TPR) repeat protein
MVAAIAAIPTGRTARGRSGVTVAELAVGTTREATGESIRRSSWHHPDDRRRAPPTAPHRPVGAPLTDHSRPRSARRRAPPDDRQCADRARPTGRAGDAGQPRSLGERPAHRTARTIRRTAVSRGESAPREVEATFALIDDRRFVIADVRGHTRIDWSRVRSEWRNHAAPARCRSGDERWAVVDPEVARVVGLLIDQARDAYRESRYPAAAAAATRAVQAAEQLTDPNLLIRALLEEADALRMAGDNTAALARYTRLLGLAQDPHSTLDDPASRAVAQAYTDWADTARFAGGIPIRDLFQVLDAAEHWLIRTGHPHWRAGILLERAMIHNSIGQLDQAISTAQDALTAYRADAPGYTLAAHRSELGDLLRRAGRAGEARPLYQAILDDPATSAYGRKDALEGLARCALADNDPTTAVAHATAAVRTAEALGDAPLLPALEALVAAHRAAGDLDTAAATATRHLDTARRIGTHYRLFYALCNAVDIALDQGHTDTARSLLTELDQHATALDNDANTTTYTTETARRHQRLTTA